MGHRHGRRWLFRNTLLAKVRSFLQRLCAVPYVAQSRQIHANLALPSPARHHTHANISGNKITGSGAIPSTLARLTLQFFLHAGCIAKCCRQTHQSPPRTGWSIVLISEATIERRDLTEADVACLDRMHCVCTCWIMPGMSALMAGDLNSAPQISLCFSLYPDT